MKLLLYLPPEVEHNTAAAIAAAAVYMPPVGNSQRVVLHNVTTHVLRMYTRIGNKIAEGCYRCCRTQIAFCLCVCVG